MAQLTSNFLSKILTIEGGYQNIATDSGNYCGGDLLGTKYGMSAVAVGEWWGRCPTEAEMRGLTESDAQGFYAWYFDKYQLFQIENQTFFELLANNAMGSPSNAARVAQSVLINEYHYNISEDGLWGPETIGALNDAWLRYGGNVYNSIRKAWVDYLQSLNRTEFIVGWMNRMNKYFPPIGVGSGVSIGLALLVLYVGWKLSQNQKAA